jgi:hypothetical protein
MKLFRLFTVTAAAVALASTASAQSRGAGAPKAPHTTSAPKGAPKAGTSTGSGKSAAPGQLAKSTDGSKPGKGTGRSKPSTSEQETTTPTDTTADADAPEANALALKISKNSAQMARIQPQLDALGLTLDEATKGFRNQGQFLAALNASTSRHLDFLALQEAMTGPDKLSLGQAAKKVANTPPETETPPAPTGTTGTTGTTTTGTTGTTSGQAQ